MAKIIDAKALACPQPVLLTKKALEQENNVTVIVDNEPAVENIKRLGKHMGCTLAYRQARRRDISNPSLPGSCRER